MTEHTEEYVRMRATANNGELYVDVGPGLEELEAERAAGKELVYDFNRTRPSETAERTRILTELLGSGGDGEHVWFEPPLHVSYGKHIHLAGPVYANFNLTIVDDADVFIGARVMFAPNVTISTAGHPVDPALRPAGEQFSTPVRIEDDVWVGSNVTILPGITIGAGSVIGAGAVVTKNVPPRVVVGGVPARIIRPIGPEDAEFRYRAPGTLS
ncbi:sugar O-acetyltransferase [Microbacteriaceae bacterium VKM Ac-2855]|nr:sugar O-acetyltransferase [Microbacteriaceae bacterium VKM Ac-2855]